MARNNGYPKNRIPDEVIAEKAKQLNVEVKERYTRKGHTYLRIKCLTHLDKPEREVELYNFLHRDKTCGCMLQSYTIEDLKNNPNVRGDLEIIGEYVNNSTPIECKCKICNIRWFVTPNKLTQGRGCPSCYANKLSSGERLIFKFLRDNDIAFEQQKSFDKCKNPKTNRLLKFDFYLPEYNLCIEFQGKQHYEPVIFNNSKSNKTKEEKLEEAKKALIENQYRDNIKREFCKNNNIKLLEIKYDQQKQTYDILKEYLEL